MLKRIIVAASAGLAALAFAMPAAAVPSGSSPGLTPPNAIPGVANLDATSLPHFQSCLSKVLTNTGDCVINFVGDSGTGGVISNASGSTYAGGRAYSYPTQLIAALKTAGYQVNNASFFGDSAAATHGSNVSAYDPRVTLGAGWAANTGLAPPPPGGFAFYNTTTNTTVDFAPTETINSCDVYYVAAPGYGSISWAVDGGSATTISEAATAGIGKATISLGTAGTHVIHVARVSGTATLQGMDCKNTGVASIRGRNLAIGGSTLESWASTNAGVAPGAVMSTAFLADLDIIDLGSNSMATDSAATMQSLLTTIISQINPSATSDILLILQFPLSATNYPPPQQTNLAQAVYGAAGSMYPVISWAYRWTSSANAVSLGWQNAADPIPHPTPAGYANFASWLRSILLQRY